LPTSDHAPVAGDAAILGRRYGGALFELAEEQKQLDAVAGDVGVLRELAHEGKEFRILAIDFNIERADLVKAMQAFAKAAKLHTLTGNFLALVAQNRRLAQLGAMCNAFLAELAEKRGEFSAEVRAAQPLSDNQKQQLAAQLQLLTGSKVHMSVKEDKGLIGGLVVKIGSKLIDASVKSKLARLERQLKSQQLNVVKGAA
jgi:F-type H+-transporting ATPase subunit delta